MEDIFPRNPAERMPRLTPGLSAPRQGRPRIWRLSILKLSAFNVLPSPSVPSQQHDADPVGFRNEPQVENVTLLVSLPPRTLVD